MSSQETNSVLVLAGEETQRGEPLWSYLRQTRGTWVEVRQNSRLPDDLGGYGVVILVDPYGFSTDEQERLTDQLANVVYKTLGAVGVAVVLKAEHLCMSMRGVQKPGTKVVTSAVRGSFRRESLNRSEILTLLGGGTE